jgi:predicted Rossmann fold nucleotide-binding protein DprA/Smf involved in DNA uptake
MHHKALKELALQILEINSQSYPILLSKRLGKDAPARLWVIGPPDLLDLPKTALFCSNKCPGDAILAVIDQARKWRDQDQCIISGFHSPIEKECLKILLRGVQPIIICPARSLERMRVPMEWRQGIKAGRILLLSPFEPTHRRLTATLSEQRNKLVAAMADQVYFAHTTSGGRIARLIENVPGWGIPMISS